jgi:hypothetical protein
MAKEKLDCPQVAGALVDLDRLGTAERMQTRSGSD